MRHVILLLIFYYITNQIYAQSDFQGKYIFLERSFKIENDTTVKVPLTKYVYLSNAGIPDYRWGWLPDTAFLRTNTDVLFLVMRSSEVPKGTWKKFSGGDFLIAINLPKLVDRKSVNLDTINWNNVWLTNYLTPIFEETKYNKYLGMLSLNRISDDSISITGNITVETSEPQITQKINFNNSHIPSFPLIKYQKIENQKEIINNYLDSVYFELSPKNELLEKDFNDSLFRINKFKKNHLSGELTKYKKFDYTLDKSYIVDSSRIRMNSSDDLDELLGGNIFGVEHGKSYVINLHHFEDPIKSSIDDEINFSILIEVDSLKENSKYEIGKLNRRDSKLGFWHYGPGGHVIESDKSVGFVKFNKIKENEAIGELEISFFIENELLFKLKGTFHLPITRRINAFKHNFEIQKNINEFNEIKQNKLNTLKTSN